MAMTRDRRGVFMTLMAIVVVIFLFTYNEVAFPKSRSDDADIQAERTRVVVMNNYLNVLENHIADSARAAGYLTLQNISRQIHDNSSFNITSVPELNRWLYNCMWNNTMKCGMAPTSSQTLAYSIRNLTSLVNSTMNINTDVNITSITISEKNPFEVILSLNVTYAANDGSTSGFARWNATTILNTTIDVTGIDDPLYMYGYQNGTFTAATHAFNKSVIRRLQFNDSYFTNSISGFYAKRLYIASEGRGISVLQRYTKNFSGSSSCCGVESIVHWSDLNVTIKSNNTYMANLSLVDHYFINQTKANFSCKSKGVVGVLNLSWLSPNIRIDRYGLEYLYNYVNNTDPNIYYNASCLA